MLKATVTVCCDRCGEAGPRGDYDPDVKAEDIALGIYRAVQSAGWTRRENGDVFCPDCWLHDQETTFPADEQHEQGGGI